MKDLNPLHKIVFFLNNIFALLFLASFAIPHVSPTSFPLLSVLSLAVPLIIFIHVGFVLFWLVVGFKRQFLLSVFCLLLAVGFSYFPYKFKDKTVVSGNSISIMSFNVRIFNRYDWIEDPDVPQKITEFILENNPDVVALQEYAPSEATVSGYQYKYEEVKGRRSTYGMGIFSKFPIVRSGNLDFENSTNNAIFVDVLMGTDTTRIYNVHLESFGIQTDSLNISGINEKDSRKLIKRLKSSFVKQQSQVDKLQEHQLNCPYPIILCGDFNNTNYSWAYRNLKLDLQDSFDEAGKGFGKTYSFNGYPLRIDFVLADFRFKVNEHRNFEIGLSDHEPVLVKLSQ
jgi:endonuclease/exonuclease/phosphatase family metal-dependent hydrolase